MPKNRVEKSFSERVYEVVSTIPAGRVATYKGVASALGCRAYRAVGQALNKNPYAPQVPCHRVVAQDGSLGGFAFGTDNKVQLLKAEGVAVKNGKIDRFSEVLFAFN